jgi:hypothetical protein
MKSNLFVIQKYIEKPLLIKERKFDIRLWVLITHEHRCHIFKEGYLRMSSKPFSISQESVDNPFVHLTNNAIQKHDKDYGKEEEGNILSFEQGKEHTGIDFFEYTSEQILPVIKLTLISSR